MTEPSIRTAIDTQIIANQERCIARLRADLERVESDQLETHELVVQRFNPPDDDAWHEHDSIEAAADFIEAVPCSCPETAGAWIPPDQLIPDDFDEDPCARCKVLGRCKDEVIAR